MDPDFGLPHGGLCLFSKTRCDQTTARLRGTNTRSDEKIVVDNTQEGLPTPLMKKLSLTIRKRGFLPLGCEKKEERR